MTIRALWERVRDVNNREKTRSQAKLESAAFKLCQCGHAGINHMVVRDDAGVNRFTLRSNSCNMCSCKRFKQASRKTV